MISLLQTVAHPADSAFVAGRLLLPTAASQTVSATLASGHWDDNVFLMILGLVLLVVAILMTQKIVNLFPSLLGCLMRYKECVNIEDSAKLSRDRNIIYAFSILPFALVASLCRIYDPSFMGEMSLVLRFFVTLGILLGYLGLRHLLVFSMKPKWMTKKKYAPVHGSFATFFITTVLFTLPTASLFAIFGASDSLVRAVILWLTVAIYAVFLVRKTQILGHIMSGFLTFLYLCALEILPTGLLVASAIIF